MNRVIDVDERSQVGDARRKAVRYAQAMGMDDATIDRLALAVTEAASNLVKHARAGRILLAPIVDAALVGIEVIALDKGPGIADVVASMRDGHSTAGSPGYGLGSIARLGSDLDIYSQPGRGTVLRFEVWKQPRARTPRAVVAGGVCVAKSGEETCGDGWIATGARDDERLLVVDGLGHGPDAAAAADTALRVARERPELAPEALLPALHDALRSTRGAAAAVASVSSRENRGTYAGIGNVRAFVRIGDDLRHLVSHNGTLGHHLRRIQTFDFAFPEDALLVMCSDGITSHWRLEAYPGLHRRHPAVIGAVILRDHARGNDDATVAVLSRTRH